jgi:small subunit ribosomal protein S20
MVRTYMKKVATAIEAKDFEQASAAFKTAVPYIDRMAGKGILSKNKAARHKSRLNARILALKAA